MNPAERELQPRLDLVELWAVTQRFRKAPRMVNIAGCPKLKADSDDDPAKRGQRDSPRAPANDDGKLAKLGALSYKLSPKVADIPPLPGQDAGALDSAGTRVSVDAEQPPAWVKSLREDIIGGVGKQIEKEIRPLKDELSELRGVVEGASTKADIAMSVASKAEQATENLRLDIVALKSSLAALRAWK